MTSAGSPFSVTYQYFDNTNDRRLAAIANDDIQDTPLNFSYTTRAGDLATGMTVSAGTSPSASWTYGYDPDDRLRSATEAGTVNEAARTFQASYNARNQIAQRNGVEYSYDADGELTSGGVLIRWSKVRILHGPPSVIDFCAIAPCL